MCKYDELTGSQTTRNSTAGTQKISQQMLNAGGLTLTSSQISRNTGGPLSTQRVATHKDSTPRAQMSMSNPMHYMTGDQGQTIATSARYSL